MKTHTTHPIGCQLLLFMLICSLQAVYAFPFRFVHYDVSNRLSSNSVRCILQDGQGYMWFGGDNMLNRFDGSTIKPFKNIAGDSTTIGSNYIRCMYEDAYHRIWVGTDRGIYIYNPENEQFSYFNKTTADGVTIQSYICNIVAEPNGKIWISTTEQGAFSYDCKERKLSQYINYPDTRRSTLNTSGVSVIYIDREGRVWASSRLAGVGLSCYDAQSDSFEPFEVNAPASLLEDMTAYAIAEDEAGDFWLGTWTGGFCHLDMQSRKLTPYLSPSTPDGAYHIHSLLAYKPEIMLVGSDDGLHYFNTKTKEFTMMTATEFNDKGLSDRFIYPIYKDREGGLWIGTYYGGINYSPPSKGDFKGYSHSKFNNSVNGNIISCFCEDGKGNIWIGSDDGGLNHFDVTTEQFTHYMPIAGRNSLSYHNVHSLCLDDDRLWIGTYSRGLNVMDLKSGRFKLYSANPNDLNSLDNSSVYAIFKDSEQTIWIGTMLGILRYNREQDNFMRVKRTETTTGCIAEDNRGSIWFATSGKGLYQYVLSQGKWFIHTFSAENVATISGDQVNCLCPDEQGRVWIGTDNGLCYYDYATQSFVRINREFPPVSGIVRDNSYLWITTTNGLIYYDIETEATGVFSVNDGLQSEQFNSNAILLASSGKMYLGSINGFNVIDPRTIYENDCIPSVVFTNLQVFNKDVAIDPDGILPKSLGCIDRIALSYKQNVFSIEYAALSYSAPDKNRYKYRLEGFDKAWNDVGNQQKATYTNIPPGNYTFSVIASNDDGVWNLEGRSLSITIHPPFWQTKWAYLFYLLAFLSTLAYIIYMIRKRGERKHQARMRQMQIENEKEIYNAKINFFTLIAHEIRTPVSLIIGPLEKMVRHKEELPEKVQKDLRVIDRNSQRLLSLVNQLLDFRKAEQGAFIIHFSRHNMYELLQNIYVRFVPLTEQKGFGFRMEMEDEAILATVDGEAVTKIVSNLLTNACKYATQQIVLSCKTEQGYVCISVTDDGQGISEEEKEHIFRPFYQVAQNNKPGTGIGLSLVKTLTDAHKGYIEVDSKPDQYTTFTIFLPLEHPDIVLTENTPGEPVHPVVVGETPKEEVKANEPDSLHIPTLLIVEDNAEMRQFLYESFESVYSVVIAENGKEGLEQLKRQSIDLIISDVMMPVMDGIAFAKELKNNLQYSHIPLVLLTAKTDNVSKIDGFKSGADLYVEKPFSPQVLHAQIANLLESRKSLRKKFSEMPFVPVHSMAGNQADSRFLTRLNDVIEQNLSTMDFSIDQLAEQLGISRSSLFVKIKTLAGMTPNELLQVVRLKKAAELLATRKYRVNEICYMVGFNNHSYFTKCFQKQFGKTPKEILNEANEADNR